MASRGRRGEVGCVDEKGSKARRFPDRREEALSLKNLKLGWEFLESEVVRGVQAKRQPRVYKRAVDERCCKARKRDDDAGYP